MFSLTNFRILRWTFIFSALVLIISCHSKTKVPSPDQTRMIDSVPIPKNVFTAFDEAISFRVKGKENEIVENVEVDLRMIKEKKTGLTEVHLFKFSKGALIEEANFKRQKDKIIANLLGGQTYVVIKKQPFGSIRNSYNTLCKIDKFKNAIRPGSEKLICTLILCSPESFQVGKLVDKFPELTPLQDDVIRGGTGSSIGDWKVGGHGIAGRFGESFSDFGGLPPDLPGGFPEGKPIPICEQCGLFGGDGIVFPGGDCDEEPVLPSAEVELEIEINRTETIEDDYVTWAPTFSRIRIKKGLESFSFVQYLRVVLTNDPPTNFPKGGDVLFAQYQDPWPTNSTATQETLTLTLPRSGKWVNFVIAGKFGRPSTEDKDAVIKVHINTENGAELAEKALMVRIRKNAESLDVDERRRFLDAVRAVKDKGLWDEFPRLHERGVFEEHFYPGFIPWHRAFILHLERELQKEDASVALPYWDFSKSSALIFTEAFMGSNPGGGGVFPIPGTTSTPPWEEADYAIPNPLVDWTWFMTIDFQGTTPVLASNLPILRDSSINHQDVVPQGVNPDVTTLEPGNYQEFRAMETNPHNPSHDWVGGTTSHFFLSPSDPTFFLLHANIDRLWACWQHLHDRFDRNVEDYNLQGSFQNTSTTPKGHYIDDKMWPWSGETGDLSLPEAYDFLGRFFNGQWSFSQVTANVIQQGRPTEAPLAIFPRGIHKRLGPGPNPTPGDMIDYLGMKSERYWGFGYSYDGVPFGAQTFQCDSPT